MRGLLLIVRERAERVLKHSLRAFVVLLLWEYTDTFQQGKDEVITTDCKVLHDFVQERYDDCPSRILRFLATAREFFEEDFATAYTAIAEDCVGATAFGCGLDIQVYTAFVYLAREVVHTAFGIADADFDVSVRSDCGVVVEGQGCGIFGCHNVQSSEG